MPDRYRGIDGLRALAVTAVLVHHWLPEVPDAVPLGRFGVRLFFVISGFLITGILLAARERVEAGGRLGGELGGFWARRALRIFPAYYLMLGLAALGGFAGVTGWLGWHAVFATNFAQAIEDRWLGVAMPLWSLAVEEQFYAVWPAVILLTPRRWLIPIILAMIAVSPLFRWLLLEGGAGEIAINVLAPSSFDALGLGALLALWRPSGRLIAAGAALSVAVLAGLVALVAADPGHGAQHVWLLPAASLCFACALAAVLRWPTAFGALDWKPVAALGTISYGVYLYHLLVERLVDRIVVLPEGPLRIAVLFAATLAVAAASWRFLEKPMLGLKRHFTAGRAPDLLARRMDGAPRPG